ncbi:Ace2 transcription factor [Candida orthopsilosis Co 90-125]|uniref:Ace2 transcription factor n=1 Tax=Candida orthopsilosis (strain 90-125) TaxID=1136231 RepID=H8X638_CANO9|nr:Ace2 transcription factor [Candida orthopsilosis Co 90-125]CCG23286.1 Ace2 transcription factor [Candida orthopsilosis Co 90-125]
MEKYIMFGDEGETMRSDLQLNVDNLDQFWLPQDLNSNNNNNNNGNNNANDASSNNDIDYLINETLNGLQDLDVPSGFAMTNNGGGITSTSASASASASASYSHHSRHKSKTHSRQMSGTAIFGFIDHTRDWSIGGTIQPSDFYKPNQQLFGKSIDWRNINPGDLLNGAGNNQAQSQQQQDIISTVPNQSQSRLSNKPIKKDTPSQDILNFNFEKDPAFDTKFANEDDYDEEDAFINNRLAQSSPIKQISTPTKSQQNQSYNNHQISATQPRTLKQNDYVVTNQSPKSYKFPPPQPRSKQNKTKEQTSPSPLQTRSNKYQYRQNETNKIVNSYSAKYLQSLQYVQQQQQQKTSLMSDAFLQPKLPYEYVDDFEPLLEERNMLKHENDEQMGSDMRYVPLPVHEPVYSAKAANNGSSYQANQQQEQLMSPAMTQTALNTKQQPSSSTEQQQLDSQQGNELVNNLLFNTFLPPPSPPTLSNSNDSPNWQSSPEPQSPSPGRPNSLFQHSQQQDISPLHPSLRNSSVNFYTPMYYNREQPQQQSVQQLSTALHHIQEEEQLCDNETPHKSTLNQIQMQQQQLQQLSQRYNPSSQSSAATGASSRQSVRSPSRSNNNNNYLNSSPFSTINSSPIRYYTSPDKPTTNRGSQQSPSAAEQDASPDPNATIAQITPLRNNTYLSTPVKSKTLQQQQPSLEWSPLISPNSKNSLKKQLKDSSPRNRVKKTSLLPPGAIDNYWIGPTEDKNFICTFKNCGKVFTRRYNVRSHVQTHLSDRPFGCQFCGKRFVRQHDLNRHLKGHNESKLSKCACGKEFVRVDAMRKHQERNICVGGIKGMVNKPSVKKKIGITNGGSNDGDIAGIGDERVQRKLFTDLIQEQSSGK